MQKLFSPAASFAKRSDSTYLVYCLSKVLLPGKTEFLHTLLNFVDKEGETGETKKKRNVLLLNQRPIQKFSYLDEI